MSKLKALIEDIKVRNGGVRPQRIASPWLWNWADQVPILHLAQEVLGMKSEGGYSGVTWKKYQVVRDCCAKHPKLALKLIASWEKNNG